MLTTLGTDLHGREDTIGVLNYNEIVEAVKAKLADPPHVDAKEYQQHIDESIAIYSLHRPRELVVDTTGNGTFEYDMPSGFVQDFSSIVQIEYPYDASNQYPIPIKEGRDWRMYRDVTDVQKIRFLTATPSSAETFRTTFTALHSVTTTTTSIPAVDERAVTNLAAALLAEQLAAEFEKKAPSTMPDATIDLRTKSQEYQTQADRYYRLWRIHMGISEDGRPEAAVGWTDFDWRMQSGRAPLTHPIQRQ